MFVVMISGISWRAVSNNGDKEEENNSEKYITSVASISSGVSTQTFSLLRIPIILFLAHLCLVEEWKKLVFLSPNWSQVALLF